MPQEVELAVRILQARGLREVNPELFDKALVEAYCLCEIFGRDDERAPSFRTRSVSNEDSPKWNASTQMVIEQGEALIFMVNYKDDGTEDDVLGWAKLEFEKMLPYGFVGEIRLTDAAATNKVLNGFREMPEWPHPAPPFGLQPVICRLQNLCKRFWTMPRPVTTAASWPRPREMRIRGDFGVQPPQRATWILPADAVEWAFQDQSTTCLGGTHAACVFFDVSQASVGTLWAACETVQGGGIICLVLPAWLTLKDVLGFLTDTAPQPATADQKLGEALLPRLVQSLWQLPACGFVDSELELMSGKPIGFLGGSLFAGKDIPSFLKLQLLPYPCLLFNLPTIFRLRLLLSLGTSRAAYAMDASSDVPQLWVALTPEQWNALDTGALPDENSGRFGLRTTAAEALDRAQFFMDWTKEGPKNQYPHSVFTVCQVHLTTLGYVKKMEGNVLQKMDKPGEYRWWGALKREESDEQGRLLFRVSERLSKPPAPVTELAPEPDELLQLCCTECQRRAFRAILEAIASLKPGCQRVVSLTGRRGRGKSSVAALALAALLRHRKAVVVTGPEGVQSIFRFAARVMQTEESQLSLSGRARFLPAESVPGYAAALASVDDAPVLIVDEMASLPIPALHRLLSAEVPLILLLGTLSGAEGTGAAIEEKVFKELGSDSAEACHHASLPSGVSKRDFIKLSLQEPVRYKLGDPVEQWLDSLLYLDVPAPPADPEAYGVVGRAKFLEIDPRSEDPLVPEVMGLLRGHYRTSPNDLTRLVMDSHIRTFALVSNEGKGPPAVVVVAIEETPERLGSSGAPVHQTHLLAHGVEKEFPHLALARQRGLRPWRVVAAPASRGRGFGQRALQLLEAHVRGLGTFDWLGVSFGLTAQLFRFWSRAKYRAVVMSHAPNDLTGEMSMKMLLPLSDA
ncbi:unnamed protein product, partial [Effrenium voratum]